MAITRNSRKYKEWRLYALKRDGYKCKVCGHDKFLHVHHIYPWKHYKKLRVDNNNSVTLCRQCHKILRFRELSFASMFKKVINNKPLDKTEQTLFNMILKNKKVKLYGGTVKSTKKSVTKTPRRSNNVRKNKNRK